MSDVAPIEHDPPKAALKCVIGVHVPISGNLYRTSIEAFDEHERGREVQGTYSDSPDPRWACSAQVRYQILEPDKWPQKWPDNPAPIKLYECARCGTVFAEDGPKPEGRGAK